MQHMFPKIDLLGLDLEYLKFDLSSIFMILLTCGIVLTLAILGARNASVDKPSMLQNFMEWTIEFVHGLIASTMDMQKGKKFIKLGLTLIMFVFVANMLGLPLLFLTEHKEPFQIFGYDVITQEQLNESKEKFFDKNPDAKPEDWHGIEVSWWKSPTADASVTMALALTVIVMTHTLGMAWNRKHYLHHYFEPFPVFFPLNLIKEVSKLLTLGLRLFGNIYAGEVMIAVILMAGVFGIPALMVWQGFSIFVGAIQAFVFTTLTMVYISQNIEHKH